jgi:5-methylcytosine-specific restriction endonuclease McrA
MRSRNKGARLRLDAASYRALRQTVLKRDGWRCQNCGASSDLQIHHICRRSAQGSDVEENLITLCAACHRQIHVHGAALP